MQQHRIIRAGAGELAAIEDIARRTWPDTFGDILSSTQIDYMLERMYSPQALREQLAGGHVFHLLLIADENTEVGMRYRPVGYVSHEIDYELGTTKIHKLYLLPEMQGRGYGHTLLRYVEQLARTAGQQRLRLDVNYQNKALGFYERMGFAKLERYDTNIGNGFLMEDWRMEKGLDY